ncbi:MAG: citryl-CoA lyase [Gammaproteobacteria bacterium]|nr:MAG: citryl-CoA lyase [Gammaproteobacteria bacterium]
MSSEEKKQEVIHSKIWREEPEPDNPFAAKKCFCAGYDVYGDLLGKASWIEYLYLLFKLEKPTKEQATLLETIAVAIANPGIRDHSVRAAMNAGVGGSTAASALMAALAVGAGQYGGAREVFLVMQLWEECGQDITKWKEILLNPPKEERADIWLPMEHPPGFDPHGVTCPTPVMKTLDKLSSLTNSNSNINWLKNNQSELEKIIQIPVSFTGLIATALRDLELSKEQGEMLYLLLRLPGAGANALEQSYYGCNRYPFFLHQVNLKNESRDK